MRIVWSVLFVLVIGGVPMTAQDVVRLADPTALVLNMDLAQDRTAMAGMQAAGLDETTIQEVVRQQSTSKWPVGMRTDSARAENGGAMKNLALRKVCDYSTDEGLMSIVAIRALDNLHMPDDLRSGADVYLVVRASGLAQAEAAAQRPAPSRGPGWRTLPVAKIIKADDLYATYDLSKDSDAMAAMENAGLSRPEIEAVIFRSHERNWPEGIDSFDERYPRLQELQKLKARQLTRWNDKVLLVMPAELNKKAPTTLKPYLDIYLVYGTTAVQVKEKKKRKGK